MSEKFKSQGEESKEDVRLPINLFLEHCSCENYPSNSGRRKSSCMKSSLNFHCVNFN